MASPTPPNGSSLRIAQVAPLWAPIPPATYGGIELLMKLLIDALIARGHEVTLFASGDCLTDAKLHAVTESNVSEMMARGAAFGYEHYANAAMAEVLPRAGDFDIIHYHLGPAWLPLAATLPTPSLFTIHTCPQIDDEFVFRRWPQVAVNGISHSQMRPTEARTGRKFPVVYNACDFSASDPAFERGSYLAYLGRMSREKNPLDAIRIARRAGLPIILAGQAQGAQEERYFTEEIEPLIDGESVRWLGLVDHPHKCELLRNAAALVFPIQWDEPFGLVMIEAMACGTPVVARSRGAVPEVVDEGITGFHSDSIDALPDLVSSAMRLDRRKVRAHAESRFGHATLVDAYLALYSRILESHANLRSRV